MMPFSPEMASRLRFITISDAARYYGLDTKTIRSKIGKNLIAFIRIDNVYRIGVWKDDYEKYLAEKEAEKEAAQAKKAK